MGRKCLLLCAFVFVFFSNLAYGIYIPPSDDRSPPNSVTNMSVASSDYDGSYSVSWNLATGGVIPDNLVLEESKNSGGWVVINNPSRTSESFFVSGRGDGSYRYRVKACKTKCSRYSTSGSIVVAKTPGVPSSISNSATSGTGRFSVRWGGVERHG